MSFKIKEDEAFCLGEELFQNYCYEFIKHSEKIGDGWEWKTVKDLCGHFICCIDQVHTKGGIKLGDWSECQVQWNKSIFGPIYHAAAYKLRNMKLIAHCNRHMVMYMGCDEGYMSKTVMTTKPINSLCIIKTCSDGDNQNDDTLYKNEDGFEDLQDDCQATGLPRLETVRYEYHVVYSSSYQVPVLYFRACYTDGKPLTLEEIWGSVNECYRDHLLQEAWETITQQEHPLLGQPFFVLHPCRTAKFMSAIFPKAQQSKCPVNYITTWLSMVGPVVGLNLHLSYASSIPQCSTEEPD
ncbi:ubiquitin-like-conjugating enzyme ATG10 isoform X2 [Protopterus annectens]|nr:ubiquitin-like-conjugating enzyme ATG10 isoform X2 [Protopterus annectens]XP_043920183.1 ubiquitin-like-conjugating enzyme ATG10 isoform X2 [Protopterus annectens]XP_043920184.1 ubiquitin-like-conjugating enzyme ATG10 isoform X2 [Protopterus annectens]XP_043920185.1 ubiquitin-like-conjugating enzyme ATG10 isoform X2 [Protopterus annectens]XP_043920186.1 ubiquitin-like-conjugating enzyme ATG10 isoform X2 [Protopterus annectens]XP_043920187.1 ubiquitin-like-conjugating enzyme ATG10 isoform X2